MSPAALALLPLLAGSARGGAPEVLVRRLAEDEIQPQLARGADGALHLLTFRGDPASGEILYRSSRDEGERWSEPVVVGAGAIALGQVSGARLALGRGGLVHVAWMGAADARPRAPGGGAPLLVTRSRADGTFEPARNAIAEHPGLDGGPDVAADASGRVWVAWQAPLGASEDERDRRLWVARSLDDGATFEPERLATALGTGACACCRVTLACAGDELVALYRSAHGGERDMVLSVSRDGGLSFESRALDAWRAASCPVSTASLLAGPGGPLAAWERAGALSLAWLEAPVALAPARTARVVRLVTGSDGWGPVRRRAELKHPALARDAEGRVLVAALADVGHGREAKLDWTVLDAAGEILARAPAPVEPVPAWSLPAAFARADGGFVVLY